MKKLSVDSQRKINGGWGGWCQAATYKTRLLFDYGHADFYRYASGRWYYYGFG